MATIVINDKQYNLKYTVRALMMFEQVKGKMFSLETLTDQYLFLYCLILANNETDLKFEQLLSYIDDDPSIFSDFASFMKEETDRQNELSKKDKKEGDKGKN